MVAVKNNIEWIDGAKGVAAISVILLHCLPCLKEIGYMLHIGQAVPVFIFISAYLISTHFTTIESYFTIKRFVAKLKKIFVPFSIVTLLCALCMYVGDYPITLRTIIKGGGIGPGSYYPWIYMQIWFLTPFIVLLIRKTPIFLSLLITIAIAIISEYIFCILENNEFFENIYRMTLSRYIMVLYLGGIWPILNKKGRVFFLFLGVFSTFCILNDCYLHFFDLYSIVPIFWMGYHWYTAFYVILIIVLLERIKYDESIKILGKYCWHIFLFQMFCYSFVL